MKISEVAKLLDMPVTTIRFYEDEGILCPKRKESGYREYSLLDIYNLLECLRYRGMGLSVKEAACALHEEGLPYLKERISENRGRLEEAMRMDTLLLEELQQLESLLETLPENVGRSWVISEPKRRYVVVERGTLETYGDLVLSSELFQTWSSLLPLVYGTYLLDLGEAGKEGENAGLCLALMAKESIASFFHLERGKENQTLPEQKYLRTIVAETGENPPGGELFAQALKEAGKLGKPQGMALAKLLVRCREGEETRRYWEVLVPLGSS